MQESLIKSPRFLRLEWINRSSSKDLFSDLFDVVEFPKLTRHKFQSFMQTDLKKIRYCSKRNQAEAKNLKNLKKSAFWGLMLRTRSQVLNICQKSFFSAKIVTEQVLNDSLMQHHFASVKISAKKTKYDDFFAGISWRCDLVASNHKVGGFRAWQCKIFKFVFLGGEPMILSLAFFLSLPR